MRRTKTRIVGLRNDFDIFEDDLPKVPAVVVQLHGEQRLIHALVDGKVVRDSLPAGGGGGYGPVAAVSWIFDHGEAQMLVDGTVHASAVGLAGGTVVGVAEVPVIVAKINRSDDALNHFVDRNELTGHQERSAKHPSCLEAGGQARRREYLR